MSMNASMQYFAGGSDGEKFITENPADKIYRPDYGPDYYAAIFYNQLPAGHQPAAIGWDEQQELCKRYFKLTLEKCHADTP